MKALGVAEKGIIAIPFEINDIFLDISHVQELDTKQRSLNDLCMTVCLHAWVCHAHIYKAIFTNITRGNESWESPVDPSLQIRGLWRFIRCIAG